MLDQTVAGTEKAADKEGSRDNQHVSRMRYLAVWRWHFFAGVYVLPFLLVLSLSGLAMLYGNNVAEWLHSDTLHVPVQSHISSPLSQMESVEAAYPNAHILQFVPGVTAGDVNQFFIATVDGRNLSVNINPYTDQVTSAFDMTHTWYGWANAIHGTLLIGDTGNHLLEIAASLGVLLVFSGLYLWWPRDKQNAKTFVWPFSNGNGRSVWKNLHASVGFYGFAVLLFFLVSGLSWTNIWGQKLVQAWSSLPAQMFKQVPLSDTTHASLNIAGQKEVPWGVALTPMPKSGSKKGDNGITGPVNLDSVVAYAKQFGLTHYTLSLPQSQTGVYTLSANTVHGDIANPENDRTVHIDQYSGKVLADIGWGMYGPMARSMAAGIAFHKGNMGGWNKAFNTIFCLGVIFMCVSAIVMWWLRRPRSSTRLNPPPVPKNQIIWWGTIVIFIGFGALFPLGGFAMMAVVLADILVLSRIPALKRWYS